MKTFVAESVEIRHTCGHDGHTAVLLGAAHPLARLDDFSGSITFIFQPAEENEVGAKMMIDDSLFDRSRSAQSTACTISPAFRLAISARERAP